MISQTDELGLTVSQGPVHIHDLQATLLLCFGLDHKRLIYRSAGRDFRLTDAGGEVATKMLASQGAASFRDITCGATRRSRPSQHA